jgi:hypothetical protein
MADALEYALPTTRAARPLWQRVVMVPMYYLGWTVGWGVAGWYVAAVLAPRSLDDSSTLIVSGVISGVAGAVLGHLGRRRRWPQLTLVLLGGAATTLVSYGLYDMWLGPRGMFWGVFFVFGMILLSGGVAALTGGAAGIALTRCR